MSTCDYSFLATLANGIPIDPLPENKSRNCNIPHAPIRNVPLTDGEKQLAVSNALRYFPKKLHGILHSEFEDELKSYGHIYMYRFTPPFPVKAYPIQYYPGNIMEAKAIMLMMMNNMDPSVAQFPQELVVYGGNGQVLSNWAQFWLVMKYLCAMTSSQTLVMYSGHPVGLFPSVPQGPRMVVTNGMVIPNYSKPEDYDRYFALGVSMYGQMTAGSYAFIGPQGIVHGTTIVLFNAAKKYLKTPSLKGKVYVSSGLGGMSGAQAKAAVITGVVGVIAEVNPAVLKKRFDQGWLHEIISDLDQLVTRIKVARQNGEATSIGYFGNIVDLWERLSVEYEKTGEPLVDLGSDQTSLHIPFSGGYCPVSLSVEEAEILMKEKPSEFKIMVQKSLHRHVIAIRKMTDAGMRFWDYGNAFLLEAKRAGAPILSDEDPSKFIYPTYVEDIIGDVFALGFGPFRWVCCSGLQEDLLETDKASAEVLMEILKEENLDADIRLLYEENLKWIREASQHNLVVGSQARLMYSDYIGRLKLAKIFNRLIKSGKLKGPVVISRDHHDVSGTDSPFRETSNMEDGSKFTADMAVQNFIGVAMRGATWVALHNGGGIGWGEVMNGNFGLLLTGDNDEVVENLILWDVNHGVVRRAWAGNISSKKVLQRTVKMFPNLQVTVPE